mgnify:CR=1 FL=1
MFGNPLDSKLINQNSLSGINRLVHIFKNNLMIFIETGKPFQSILALIIKGNNNIPDFCCLLFQDDNEISLRDAGIFHRITFGAENIKVAFPKKVGRKIYVFFDVLFFCLCFPTGNTANDSSASCIHCPMVKFLCVNANTIVNEETFFVHFHKVSVYR